MTGLVETPNDQRLLWTKLFVFQIKTPSKVYLDFGSQSLQAPFYRTVWFVVLLAAASIVIIIMVVAILCVKAKTYKYKGKKNGGTADITVSHSNPNLPRLCSREMSVDFIAVDESKVFN